MKQLGFCVIAPGLSAPAGADSVLTSQGQPNLVGVPFTGIPGMEFPLFDEPVDGGQVGEAVIVPAMPMKEGIFQAALEFSAAFDDSPREPGGDDDER